MALNRRFVSTLLLAAGCATGSPVMAAPPDRTECIAPARPGGGFDLSCQLASLSLLQAAQIDKPMRTLFLPGAIGAVAFNVMVTQRPADSSAIVAFSGGTLMNLAQGKYGKYSVNDVRWLAAVGVDYGIFYVRADSPFRTLKDLVAAWRQSPANITIGVGGTIGSQDWLKAVLIARQAGIAHEQVRYVAFEGGGETTTALLGGHIQVASGDLSEASQMLRSGKVRALAILANKRLNGALATIPTAKEQGYDLVWPIIRGFYVGPKVSDADYRAWEEAFRTAMSKPDFAKLRDSRGLFPFSMTGAALDAYVKRQVQEYKKTTADFGLVIN